MAAEEAVVDPHTGRGAEQATKQAGEKSAAATTTIAGSTAVTRGWGTAAACGPRQAHDEPEDKQSTQAHAHPDEPLRKALGPLGVLIVLCRLLMLRRLLRRYGWFVGRRGGPG